MDVVIQMSKEEALKALPILYRHSPGVALQGGQYVISQAAAEAIKAAGVQFTLIATTVKPSRSGEGTVV